MGRASPPTHRSQHATPHPNLPPKRPTCLSKALQALPSWHGPAFLHFPQLLTLLQALHPTTQHPGPSRPLHMPASAWNVWPGTRQSPTHASKQGPGSYSVYHTSGGVLGKSHLLPDLDFLFCKETASPHMVGTQGQSGRTKAPLSSLSDGVHMGFSSKVQLFRHKLLPLSPSPPPLPAF